jgi:nitroimidazol reductase NimA-like FMN-containing flavoprotein (pyridoxamine 5'-phosphate oxidase superfamily)
VRLSEAECWAFLAASKVGRIAYSEAAMPQIRAVPHVADGGSVIIAMRRSATHPGLFDAPTVVAFEAGEWASHGHEGWSVHFIGKARILSDFEVADIAARGLTSWIEGAPAVQVRIRAEIVSGSRTLS